MRATGPLRRSLVVVAGRGEADDRVVEGLVSTLGELSVETIYLGREQRPGRIATVVAEQRADAIELCLAGAGGVAFLRELLRELIDIGRRDVSIVVHRVDAPTTAARHPASLRFATP
jgi:methylmalonyl-CoA mutase cobalamin-binding subunit